MVNEDSRILILQSARRIVFFIFCAVAGVALLGLLLGWRSLIPFASMLVILGVIGIILSGIGVMVNLTLHTNIFNQSSRYSRPKYSYERSKEEKASLSQVIAFPVQMIIASTILFLVGFIIIQLLRR